MITIIRISGERMAAIVQPSAFRVFSLESMAAAAFAIAGVDIAAILLHLQKLDDDTKLMYIRVIRCLLRKDHPLGPWEDHQPNPATVVKGGCFMSIKRLIKKVRFTGITLNIGFIGLNFAGGLS
jgi:hypothetical protein